MEDTNWIQIGIVGKSYGLRGAFYVSGRDEPIADQLQQVIISKNPQKSKPLKIISQKIHKGRTVLIIDGILGRTAMKALLGLEIWVDKDVLSIEEDEEYFWDELVGRKIVNLDGSFFGEIIDIFNHGASDIIEVKNEGNSTIELPFVDGYFDMSFERDEEGIRLVVDKENFADLWQEPRKK